MKGLEWMRDERDASLWNVGVLVVLVAIVLLVAILVAESGADATQEPGVPTIESVDPNNQFGIREVDVEMSEGIIVTCLYVVRGALDCDWR